MSFKLRALRSALLVSVVALAMGCKGGDGGGGSNSTATPDAVPASPTTPTTPTTPSTPTTPTANAAPTIGGTAVTAAKANTAYSFAPAATDTNGDTLTFQIENKPSWATFNTLTGQLSGSPTTANVGTFANIVISVSDGQASASLDAFTITVGADGAVTTDVTVSWIAPTENLDGSALTDLAGFEIAYGPSESTLTQTVRIENPSIDQYQIEDLVAGTYYFGIKAFTASGDESALSSIEKKEIY